MQQKSGAARRTRRDSLAQKPYVIAWPRGGNISGAVLIKEPLGMRSDPSDRAKVIALPPLILAATLALGVGLHLIWPVKLLPGVFALPLGLVLIFGAIALAAFAVREMHRANTAVDIRKPATAIVTSGVFKLSRNPIYLGMVLLCLGIALAINSLWIFASAAPLALVLQKGVIEREEAYLAQKFGAAYLQYKASVRRWI
jgi:protein-S-isoprenylcysteine O-methyltransferase Ste14